MRNFSFRGTKGANYAAKEIAKVLGVGSGTRNTIATVLRELKNEIGINSTRKLTADKISKYTEYLQDRVKNGEISQKTATDRISALNGILRASGQETRVSASNLGFKKDILDTPVRATTKEEHNKFIEFLEKKYEQTGDERYKALSRAVEMQRSVGLRLAESLALKIQEKNPNAEKLHLTPFDMPKNARERDIPLSVEARQNLEQAKEFAQERGWSSLIPPGTTLRSMENFAEKVVQEYRQETGEYFRYHAERHAYAQERLQKLMDQGVSEQDSRLQVSEELGHGREEITLVYTR